MRNVKKLFVIFTCLTFSAIFTFAQDGYKKPPKEIMGVLNAPETPFTTVSPAKDKILLLEYSRYPPIADLAEPMLRLAGSRVNVKTNSSYNERYFTGMIFKNIADGKEMRVSLPKGAKITSPTWSADGKYVAAGNLTENGVELWVIDTTTAKANKINNVMLNTAVGGIRWMPDQRSLFVNVIPKDRGAAPAYRDLVPTSPAIQETSGKTGAIRTFQDMLSSPNDEKLFDYYATSQLAVVGMDGAVKTIGEPAIYDEADVSPDGKYILIARIKRPYSYLFPYDYFPKEVEVWNMDAQPLYYIADIPLQDQLPVQGVPVGPRSYGWIPSENSTLMWAEALDGGDPRNKADFRDKLMKMVAPFTYKPIEVLKLEQRYAGKTFGEKGMMWVSDYDRDTQKRRMFMTDYKENSPKMRLVYDINIRDRYNDIGDPVMKTLPNGERIIWQYDEVEKEDEEAREKREEREEPSKREEFIYLEGSGASAEGDRPFLRRMNLKTLKIDELWRSTNDSYETFVTMLDDEAKRFITRRETISEPSNLILRDRTNTPEARANATSMKPLTDFKDPSPQLRGITKKLIQYKRADGVDLSFTLYLPPNYKEGTRLPTIVWAYPLEYTNSAVAGQVSGSTNRFTQIGGYSHLFMLLEGYAILDNATIPIVGNDPKTVNDTFIKQLVDSAQAAVDKGVELGVVDRNRVGVGGHSYGAFMTAHLLAQSDIFKAGVARSGAYNRTLTPFGFQSERRSFWEAPDIYAKLSPFFAANKINEPLLMIHGEADNNSGTFPIQSERMFAAIQGNGGTARLVMLPYEAHGYSAKESIEHVLYEQVTWFDKYVKNAK